MQDQPRRLPWRECLILAALVSAFGLVMALFLHDYCMHAPSEVDAPVPGTPRADYCATADSGHPFLLTLAPAALALLVALASRRRSVIVVWSCVLIAIATAVIAGHASALDYNTSL
jgi:hypothetical protein